jgi:hypothetical protein
MKRPTTTVMFISTGLKNLISESFQPKKKKSYHYYYSQVGILLTVYPVNQSLGEIIDHNI